MAAKDLYIEACFPQLLPGCCPNKVYALLFNNRGQALKLSSGVYSFANYNASTGHTSSAILLAEGSQRTKCYSRTVAPAFHTLAITPDGEHYTLEFWRRTAGDTSYSRSEDTLLETVKCWWDGNALVYTGTNKENRRLSQVNEVHWNCSYDSELGIVKMMAWLHSAGQLRTDVSQCQMVWLDRAGNQILNIISNETVSFFPGFFLKQWQLADLDPDNCTPLSVTITDNDGNTYTSGTCCVTWD